MDTYMVGSDMVVVTTVVCVDLVPMFMVRERHGVVHTIRVVCAAMGGERERDGLGTEAFRSFCSGNDAAKIFFYGSVWVNLVPIFFSDLSISEVVGSAHDALYTFEVVQNVDGLKILETTNCSCARIITHTCHRCVNASERRNGASVWILEGILSSKLVYFLQRVEN